MTGSTSSHLLSRRHLFFFCLFFCLSLGLLNACAGTTALRQDIQFERHGDAYNAENGQKVSLAAFVEALSQHRHIYVGERHREALSHRTQRDVIELLHQAGVKMAIAVEWLPLTASEDLQRYIAGNIALNEMVERVEWRRYWGHNFEAYRGLFEFAREHNIPIWPLNAPKGMAAKIARGQTKTLSDAEKSYLTTLRTGTDAHRAYFFKLMAKVSHAHGHGHHGRGPSLENYYQAQLYRDEFMAEQLAKQLRNDSEGRIAIVFAGRAHVAHGLGIPQRAAQLGFPGFSIVLPVSAVFTEETAGTFGPNQYPQKRSDFLWHPARGD